MASNPKLSIPWKIKLHISTLAFGVDITRRSDGTVNRFLMSLFDVKSPPSNKPISGVTATDITVDKARNLWFRLYTPISDGDTSSTNTMPVIFYFHGGGFAYLSADSKPLDEFCYGLARLLSAIVVSVNYRLAPENRYPAQPEDCFDTVKFIDETTSILGFPSYANLKNCFLAGDSAGGNLVHHVMVKASQHKFRNVKLIGGILIQPYFGGEERTESEIRLSGKVPYVTMDRTDWMWKVYLPEGSDRDHPASNVFGPNSEYNSGQEIPIRIPPSVIFVGGFDPLIDWQKRYYEGLKKLGKEVNLIEYPNAFHTFYVYPELPEFSLFINDVKDFMQKQIVAAANN
ncbi:probable carboxylesterase 18 [Mercurialis annua]|uniref:probable carboxylesterase 18 n=1 Tax=Mercurialis annua TaxID=3986 RepID=UPI002160483B|nr:probable carboxylesterase 18 [Mercurialis annua]